jgi:hypothetical protein
MILRIVLTALFCCLLVGANCWPGLPPPTFVLAGQSNMVGSSTMAPVIAVPSPEGRIAKTYTHVDEWNLANDPVHYSSGPGTTSAWPTFVGEWMAQVGRQVNVIATAWGGSCLLSTREGPDRVLGTEDDIPPRWDPHRTDAGTGSGSLYAWMLEQVAEANPMDLRAVLWYQGECEVGYATTPTGVKYEDYKAGLKHLADHIWEDLGVPMVAAPISLRPPPWPYQPARQPIHDAIIDAAAEHPHIYLGPNTDDLEHEDDGAHIHDVVTLGERWFDAVDLAGLAY